MSLSHQRKSHDFFKQSSGTCASPPVLMDTADGNPQDPPTVQEKVLPR